MSEGGRRKSCYSGQKVVSWTGDGGARLGCERGRTKRQCNGQDQKTRAPQTMGPRSSPREHHHGVIFVVNHASTLLHEAVSGLLGYAAKDGSGVTASVTTMMAQPLQ